MEKADLAIIGGGIVGLASAYNYIKRFPDQKVVLLEKEDRLATHQTGHNSGVIHSGIYYTPGSLKAINCREGKESLETFCTENEIPFDICGKVIVALDESELPRMEKIYGNGQANGVKCEIIDRAQLLELEPHAAGIKAIHVPEAGIIDYTQVCEVLSKHVQAAEGNIVTGARVTGIRQSESEVVLNSTAGDFVASHVINCAGLYCDRVTRMGGQTPEVKIIPFRGEYFDLKPEARYLCRNLIYPVPDPKFPFLGVHFTRMIDNSVECGPNAVLAFAREGYKKWNVSVGDMFETLTYSGFIKMAFKYWRMGAGEMWRSFNKRAFVSALQRLLPEIRSEHLVAAPAGIRAQAIGPDGSMADDFLIQENSRVVNVCNAPSPAATASLNIGKHIIDNLEKRL